MLPCNNSGEILAHDASFSRPNERCTCVNGRIACFPHPGMDCRVSERMLLHNKILKDNNEDCLCNNGTLICRPKDLLLGNSFHVNETNTEQTTGTNTEQTTQAPMLDCRVPERTVLHDKFLEDHYELCVCNNGCLICVPISVLDADNESTNTTTQQPYTE
ncbi:hypothetical protein BsWGS_08713 [Bradybaena similaris]